MKDYRLQHADQRDGLVARVVGRTTNVKEVKVKTTVRFKFTKAVPAGGTCAENTKNREKQPYRGPFWFIFPVANVRNPNP